MQQLKIVEQNKIIYIYDIIIYILWIGTFFGESWNCWVFRVKFCNVVKQCIQIVKCKAKIGGEVGNDFR